MEFGIFDHLDRRDEPPQKTFQDRLALIAAAEQAGFRGYHVAAQVEECGFNYALLQFAFGDLGHEAEMRSLALFAEKAATALRHS